MRVNPTIREAKLSDAYAINSCVEAAYRQYIPRIGKPPGPMLNDYSEVIRRHEAFVAEQNGKVIGVLVLVLRDAGVLLDNIAVHPKHQGKGLGRHLIEFAESEARMQGYTHLDLYTHELMTENIQIYKHLGYVETERRTENGYQRIYLQKSLF